MSHSDRIDAHLSGSAPPDDIDQLDAALINDPSLARELANAARLEAEIAAHFAANRGAIPLVVELEGQAQSSPGSSVLTPITGNSARGDEPGMATPTRSRTTPPWWRLAAAAVVALGIAAAGVAWLNHSDRPPSPATVAAPGSAPGAPAAAAPAFPRPPSIGKQSETPEMTALRTRLEGYHLTDLGLDQAVPLTQALSRILTRARELNHLRQPAIDSLALAPTEPTPKASEPLVRLPKHDFTLMDALRLVAVQAGSEIRLEPPGTISLSPLPKMASSKLITRSFRVRPDFLSARTHPVTDNPFEKVDVTRNALELEQQTRKEISDFRSQLESLKDKEGEELITAAAAFGIQEPKTAALLSAYLADLAELKQLEQRFGPLHPTLQNHRARLEHEKAQLEVAAVEIRNTLETKLRSASAILASVEKITEDGKKDAARHALEEFGVSFPEGTAAEFNSAKASLTVTHTEAALRQIEAFLAVDSRAVGTMIFASMKVLEFSDGHALENRLMDHGRFAEWLREQNQAGAFLLAVPSITTRSRQNATVEVMRDVVRPLEIEPDDEAPFVTDWQGTRIKVNPTLEGEVVHLTGSAEVRRPSDAVPGQLPHDPPASAEAELVSSAIDIDAVIPPGQTALFSLSENSEGPHFVATITLQLIDPSGQRLRENSEKSTR
jgi:hypothetical protein